MNALVFVDTNVFVYNRSRTEPEKQARAAAWVAHLWDTRTGRTSYQVLQEFYVTVMRKAAPGTNPKVARADVTSLAAWHPISTDAALLDQAWTVQDRFRLSFWDAAVVAAAQRAQCQYLLTEDLQPDQDLAGVRVVNPFRWEPGSLD